MADPKLNLANQKRLVDSCKAIIKSGKKATAAEKLRALKVLNKAVMAAENNWNFLNYVQKKILKRLVILGQYCPRGYELDDMQGLLTRGETIFMSDESDKKSAAHFLIVLLDCFDRWFSKYGKDPKQKKTGFYTATVELKQAGVIFPKRGAN